MVAFRNIINHKLYSFINIAGVAFGLAACVLITLFVRDELSYDQHWKNAESLHRLNLTFVLPGRAPLETVAAQGATKKALKQYFDQEILMTTRFLSQEPIIIQGENSFTEDVMWTDPETAEMFDFDVIAGDIKQTLNDNASLAINETFAKKYFGDNDPIDQILTIKVRSLTRDFRIGAVFKDLPHNTVLNFQVLAMIDEGDWQDSPWMFESWYSANNTVYFQLKDGASINSINNRLAAFTNANVDKPDGALGPTIKEASDFIKYSTQAISDIQLNPAGVGEMKLTGDKSTVTLFIVVATLILIIACINFTNLATAKSTQRAREVAMRKVLGAERKQLIAQFLGESILIALLGLFLALVLVELLLPAFNQFLDKELVFLYSDGLIISILLSLVVIVGFVAGIYPAIILSSFRPAAVLKANKSAESSSSVALRNILVVAQFAISIALMIATATVYGQMLYVTSMDLGFNKDKLLVVQELSRQGIDENKQAFKLEVENINGIEKTSIVSERPFASSENSLVVTLPDDPDAGSIIIGSIEIDYDFLDTMQVPLLAGRNISREFANDEFPTIEEIKEGEMAQGNLLINEAAVARLGYESPQQAIGKVIRRGIGVVDEKPVYATFTIVGVVSNMHYQSLKKEIRPELYGISESNSSHLMIRFQGDPQVIVADIKKVWQKLVPEVPFIYESTDEVAVKEFAQESNIATMLALFSALAVVIACLGLYGLASFTAARRTKEIGIRKVMGASVPDIVKLLVWQFSKPVLLANLIAWPVSVWFLLSWLETFPVRLDGWLLLPLCLIAGIVAMIIAWLTVGGNAAKVARANPIKALRYE